MPANIVEGYALGTTPQFARHLRIAIGSAAEAEYVLIYCRDCSYLPLDDCTSLLQTNGRLLAVLHGLLRKVRTRI